MIQQNQSIIPIFNMTVIMLKESILTSCQFGEKSYNKRIYKYAAINGKIVSNDPILINDTTGVIKLNNRFYKVKFDYKIGKHVQVLVNLRKNKQSNEVQILNISESTPNQIILHMANVCKSAMLCLHKDTQQKNKLKLQSAVNEKTNNKIVDWIKQKFNFTYGQLKENFKYVNDTELKKLIIQLQDTEVIFNLGDYYECH